MAGPEKSVGGRSKKVGEIAQILGVGVFGTPKSVVLRRVEGWVRVARRAEGRVGGGRVYKRLIYTPNSEMLVLGAEDEDFRRVLNGADLNIPDWMGVVLASWVLRWLKKGEVSQKISSRLTGVELTEALVERASRRGWLVYLLGGEGSEAELCRQRLMERWGREAMDGFEMTSNPGPRRVGEATEEEWREVRESINNFKPDLLLVAFGHGKQEPWLAENKDKLSFAVGMGVGGAFNYLAGLSRMAPEWVGRAGLEWLWRLVQEPWRWRRQLKLVKYWWLVLKEAVYSWFGLR